MLKPGCTRRPSISVADLSYTGRAKLYSPIVPTFVDAAVVVVSHYPISARDLHTRLSSP
jgi:hypothetical protein